MASMLSNWFRRSNSESEHESVRATRSQPAEDASSSNRMLGKKLRCVSLDECSQNRAAEALSKNLLEDEDEMPEMEGKSSILTEADVLRLAPRLPARKVRQGKEGGRDC